MKSFDNDEDKIAAYMFYQYFHDHYFVVLYNMHLLYDKIMVSFLFHVYTVILLLAYIVEVMYISLYIPFYRFITATELYS